ARAGPEPAPWAGGTAPHGAAWPRRGPPGPVPPASAAAAASGVLCTRSQRGNPVGVRGAHRRVTACSSGLPFLLFSWWVDHSWLCRAESHACAWRKDMRTRALVVLAAAGLLVVAVPAGSALAAPSGGGGPLTLAVYGDSPYGVTAYSPGN